MYKRYKSDGTIGAPVVRLVNPGTFSYYRDVMLEKGASPTQFKMPRVVRRPDMLELLRKNAVNEQMARG